jgi:hypothetical protein
MVAESVLLFLFSTPISTPITSASATTRTLLDEINDFPSVWTAPKALTCLDAWSKLVVFYVCFFFFLTAF